FNPLWNQLHVFQNEMNRLFDRWGEDGGRPQPWTTFPLINVWEVGDDLHVEAELPGLNLDDLEIFVTGNNQLTLKGERKPLDQELTMYADVPGVRAEDVDLRFERGELILQARVQRQQRPGQALLTEYQEGDFFRVFQIHESIDTTRISAQCKSGVLTVHLPKV